MINQLINLKLNWYYLS